MNEWVTLTNRCNNRCLFCYELGPDGARQSAWDEEPEAVLRKLREARERGFGGVVLTGGEPTIAITLGLALAEARALGFEEVILATNGRRLAYGPYAERLARAGLTHAHVSLYSHDAKVHDGLTLAPGSFNQTVDGIRHLVRLGVTVTANYIVNRRNFRDLPQYFDLLRALGLDRASVMGLKPFGGAFHHREAVSFRPAAAALAVSAGLAYGRALGFTLKTMGLSREIFDLRGTESDDRRALQYFEEMTEAMPGEPYCAALCDTCFGRAVCRHGSQGLLLGRLICKCGYVYERTLRTAIRQGARTVDALRLRTGACRRCQTCRPELEALLADERGRSLPRLRLGPLPGPARALGPGAFAGAVDVPAGCRGEEQTPGCVFARGHLVYPELPCGQRCLLGDAVPGTPAWDEALVALARRLGGPVYVYGADGASAAALQGAAAGQGLAARGDLVGSVLWAAGAEPTVADVVPAGALRHARVGARA
ncbi:MAG TPA: radical SAM protein, partial [Polyangia bacterium]